MSSIFTCQNCGSSSYEQFSQTQVRCMNCKNISEFDTGYKVPKQFEIINDSNVLDIVEKASFKRASIIKRMFNTLIDTMIIMRYLFLQLFSFCIIQSLNIFLEKQLENLSPKQK